LLITIDYDVEMARIPANENGSRRQIVTAKLDKALQPFREHRRLAASTLCNPRLRATMDKARPAQ
jgi:hypothetical protein